MSIIYRISNNKLIILFAFFFVFMYIIHSIFSPFLEITKEQAYDKYKQYLIQIATEIQQKKPDFFDDLEKLRELYYQYHPVSNKQWQNDLNHILMSLKKNKKYKLAIDFIKFLLNKQLIKDKEYILKTKFDLVHLKAEIGQDVNADFQQLFVYIKKNYPSNTIKFVFWQLEFHLSQAIIYSKLRKSDAFVESNYLAAINLIQNNSIKIVSKDIDDLLFKFADVYGNFAYFLQHKIGNKLYAKLNYHQSLYYFNHDFFKKIDKYRLKYIDLLMDYAQLEYKLNSKDTALQLAFEAIQVMRKLSVEQQQQSIIKTWLNLVADWLELYKTNITLISVYNQLVKYNFPKHHFLENSPLDKDSLIDILDIDVKLDGEKKYKNYLSSYLIAGSLVQSDLAGTICAPYLGLHQDLSQKFKFKYLPEFKNINLISNLKQLKIDQDLVSLQYHYEASLDQFFVFLTTDSLELLIPLKLNQQMAEKLSTEFLDDLQDSHSNYKKKSQKLYRAVFQLVDSYLIQLFYKSKTAPLLLLSFSKNNPLQQLPFAALYHDRHYLIEKYPLVYLQNLQNLSTVKKPNIAKNLLIGGYAKAASIDNLHFSALPAVQQEIQNITDIMPKTFNFLEKNNQLEEIKRALEKNYYNIVHIANHVYIDAQNQLAYFLLAGAEQAEKIELQAFSKLDFSSVDLLSLSACNTANQQLSMLPINQFFLQQGAQAVLASLWALNDDSTAELMPRFYASLNNGENKAVALQQAQLAFIEDRVSRIKCNPVERKVYAPDLERQPATCLKYEHPYSWAGFILTGNWLAFTP